ncbi:hypothetical protein Tco_0724435 [Tanacetum coccineum]
MNVRTRERLQGNGRKKIARQWIMMEEEKERAMSETKSSKEIDWNDPSVIRKKSLLRKSTRGTIKRQKMEVETEKEDLKGYLDIVPREEFVEDVESLSTKYPIVDWKTCVLTENFIYYQIFPEDGCSSKIIKVLWGCLKNFDNTRVMAYQASQRKYSASRPEGYV